MLHEVLRLLATGASPLAGKMLVVDLDSLDFQTVSLA
jgi:hypothetical protein